MPTGKTLAAATFGLALSAGVHSVAAQPQQSESSVQSAVRDLRDSAQRGSPPTSTRVLTGSQSAGTPPRPDGRPETGACPQREGKPCRK
jgi:hypothetical protein